MHFDGRASWIVARGQDPVGAGLGRAEESGCLRLVPLLSGGPRHGFYGPGSSFLLEGSLEIGLG